MNKKIYLALVIVPLMLTACGIGTVKWSIKNPEFQKENVPIRNIRLAVFTDDSYSEKVIKDTIEDVSDSLREEVGITLSISLWQPIKLESKNVIRVFEVAHHELSDIPGWDICVTITSYSPGEFLLAQTVGGVMAVTDDYYRRYIVVKELSSHILKHEICHCFVFAHGHSLTGIEMPMMLRLLPLTPAFAMGGDSLTPGMRKEFLHNKWRDFNGGPVIAKNQQKDVPKSWKQ